MSTDRTEIHSSSSHTPATGTAAPRADDTAISDPQEQIRALRALVVQQEAKTTSILEITNALRATRSEDELLMLIMDKISLLMDADRSTLFILDESSKELWTKITQKRRTIEVRLGVGEGIAGWVAETGQSVNIKDAYKDPRFNPDIDYRTGYQTESVLCQPMRNQDRRIIGVIQVLNKLHGYFRVEDELLLSAVASQAAIVIENSNLYHSVLDTNYELNEIRERLEHKVTEQNLLFEIQRSINQALNVDDVIRIMAEKVLRIIPSDACVVTLRKEGQTLSFLVNPVKPNENGCEIKLTRHVDDEGPSAIVIDQGVPYLCNTEDQCPPDSLLAKAGVTIRSVVAVPFFVEEKPVGSIELVNRRGVGESGGHAEFTDTDLKFLTLLVGQVAPALATHMFRERKEKADRLATVGQMLSGVLHDLKTPFAIVSGYAQLMAREEDGADRQDYAERIRLQFDHLNQMTQEILAFARGESTILLRKVYLNRFMDDVEELLTQEFEGRDIDLEMDVRYRRTAKFDEGKMKRVIFNVARNAIEAMPQGGRFRVRVDGDEEANELIFFFADSGTGVPEAIRDRLFESFVTQGKRNGTGLGLAIVKKIVEEHQGSIVFESEIGKGTTFEIRLPLEP